jgi:hypothetical protein
MRSSDLTTMRSLRAYFEVGAESLVHGLTLLVDGTPTSVGAPSQAGGSTASGPLYDLSGRRVDSPCPGIYVSRGRKVVVR